MLKFVDVKEVFAEIPQEITLAVSISGCPIRCKGCHSRYLWEDTGEPLTTEALSDMLKAHIGITCLCFMGGDQAPAEINSLAQWVKTHHPDIKTAWYSGRDEVAPDIELSHFDYLKIGRYDAEQGPLNQKTTNQRLWLVQHTDDGHHRLTDCTHHFWNRL